MIYTQLLVVATISIVVTMFLLYPIIVYLRDSLGLRKYPSLHGIGGVTNYAFVWEAIRGFRSNTLLEAHKKHPILRTGPDTLSFSSAHAIKDIYGHGTKCTKAKFYETISGTHFNLQDVVDKAEHSRKRRALASAYAIKNLEGWEFKVADKVERFVRAADQACTEPLKKGLRPDACELLFDYRKYTNLFSLDAIADIGLSEKLGFLDQADDLTTARTIDGREYTTNFRLCQHSAMRVHSTFGWLDGWFSTNKRLAAWLSPYWRAKLKLHDQFSDIILQLATKRLERYRKGERLPDFFQSLTDHSDANPPGLEWGEIVAEVGVMMHAGSDTTAIALHNSMFWLLKNPTCLEKLRDEVDSVLDPDEVVAPYDKVKHLPFLRACLDESLRLSPSTTAGMPRKTPPEGCVINNEHIAGNVTVSISPHVSHRDPSIFREPEAYIPDRWLGENGKALQPYFIAFSAGARGCIGRNISYLEQVVLLATVVHRYELALPHPDWEPKRLEAFNLMPETMPVKIWRRNLDSKGLE